MFKRVFSGSYDKTVKLLELESGKCIKSFIHTSAVRCVKQAANNKLISGCFNGSIKIWDIETGECLININAHTNLLIDILLISNDRFVTCSWDNTIHSYDDFILILNIRNYFNFFLIILKVKQKLIKLCLKR